MKKIARSIVEKIILGCVGKLVDKFDPYIILITGSAGKTTTKYVIGSVLKEAFNKNVLIGFGNLSTTTGIPLAMLEFEFKDISSWQLLSVVPFVILKTYYLIFTNQYYKYLVLEVAADRPGDIEKVVKFIKPDVGVITNIGPAHLKYFETIENIAREKSLVVKAVKNDGLVILNKDDPFARGMQGMTKAKVKLIDGNMRHFAILATQIIAENLHIDADTIKNGLANIMLPSGRFEVRNGKNGTKIIDSSYNANPTSMRAVVDEFANFPVKGKKIAVIGDMLELGSESERLHREAGSYIKGKVDLLIAVGSKSRVMPANIFTRNWQGARDALLKEINPGDTILIKASHGMHLEKILNSLVEK